MDIKDAKWIAAKAYPHMFIRGASKNAFGFAFAFDFTEDGSFPSRPGLPQIGVDKNGELYKILPGNEAFWRFLSDAEQVSLL